MAAGVAALVVSFTVLAVAWRSPRYDPPIGRPAPAALERVVDSSGLRWSLRVAGVLLAAYTMLALWGGQDRPENPVFGMFYVLLWVGLVPASLLLGPVWRALSPFHLMVPLARRLGAGKGRAAPVPYPEALGLWPGAVGLYAFVWMELVNPHGAELGPLRVWITGYVAGHGGRHCAPRRAVPRRRRSVRGLLHAGGAAFAMGTPGRSAGPAQPARQPGHHSSPPGTGRGGGCALREHGIRHLQGLDDLAAGDSGFGPPGLVEQPRTARRMPRRGWRAHGGHDGDRCAGPHPPPRPAATACALGRAHRRRLRHRPLPVVPGRRRAAHLDPDERPAHKRRQPVRHGGWPGELLAGAATRRCWPWSRCSAS